MTLTAREEIGFWVECWCAAWMADRALWDIECDRSWEYIFWFGGAKVGVLAVVRARVVVEVLGCEKGARASSLPSQHCSTVL